MKKILINQPRSSYFVGGAEMISLQHAKQLSLLGYDITFVTILPSSIGTGYSDQYLNLKREYSESIKFVELKQQARATYCYQIQPGENRDRWNVESIHFNRSLFEYLLEAEQVYDTCLSYYKFDALVIPQKYIINNLLYLCGVPKQDNEFISSFLSAYDTIIAITDEVRNYWQKYTLRDIAIVETGVDVLRFCPAQKASNNINLLFVGRLIERKGVDVLVDSIYRMSADIQRRLSLKIVGSGPMKVLLEKQIIRRNLSDKIEIIGECSSPEDYYSKADICVFPSRRGEGLQGVVLEAMSSGCCVVASETDINSRLLADGRGFNISPDCSPDELSKMLSRIIYNKDQIKSSGDAARYYAVYNFSWEKKIKELEKSI